ncbi:potassium-transporting ATPase subunit KdpC [Sporolactobacillus inulinus]|uniref:Potassium-transporting ATPase KdpC subunit n=1 Tax=Sporolactobacillus inulinus CASD TaxID=1069536 RepID=A0A0U1QLE9_9BACL|nr:potassium-transporting ATPase subunit KdpC [Sporolactobacillus inulinus]KLI01627.1 potassium-transporting ATPase subunit C [Sporolactobacillus inulinus CASD]GEB77441.1 potassium-transporting ATPase KdpC subunit [Sporolactobacillus inulinus]
MTNVWRSIRITVVFAVLLGLIYPAFITGIGNLFFPYQAKGSIMSQDGQPVGSERIGQKTDRPGLFRSRPSAINYAANGSGASNLGATNPAFVKEVQENRNSVQKQIGTTQKNLPVDMVESSASGLDPDISVENAKLQVPSVAKATGISEKILFGLVDKNKENRLLGVFGEPRVNVLRLNLAVEKEKQK